MKLQLQQLVAHALKELNITLDIPSSQAIQIDATRDNKFGDYACNVAMVLSKKIKTNPRELAQQIIAALPHSSLLEKVEVAGPGFINFYLTKNAFHNTVADILKMGEQFGCNQLGQNQKIIIEFVSCNPTGPLHVGHGRGAAYGASLANVLSASSFKVHREYYVNDAGRQMHILTLSIWLRYLSIWKMPITFPSNGYKGEYILDIAKTLQEKYGDSLCQDISHLYDDLPEDNEENKDFYIDQLIVRTQAMLTGEQYQSIFSLGLASILKDIKEDLEEFGVQFDEWFHESSLTKDIEKGINLLTEKGYTYQKDNALWFKATELGDEKDRVLIRKDGRTTYFAADVGYHLNKYERKFSQVINIFGSDHHGYIARIKAFLTALGKDINKLHILLVQFAILYRGKERVKMSTRGGQFVTLRELREEVGNDAARFFYIMRKAEQHLDFDLELAKSRSNENPVYYIQYAHARVCSVFRQAEEKKLQWDKETARTCLDQLTSDYEMKLLRTLTRYPEVVYTAACNYEPHLIAHYLQELASEFHAYYNAEQFLVEEQALRNARLGLIDAVKIVLSNGLKLLGVSAPTMM